MILVEKLHFPHLKPSDLVEIFVELAQFLRVFVNFCQCLCSSVQEDENPVLEQVNGGLLVRSVGFVRPRQEGLSLRQQNPFQK